MVIYEAARAIVNLKNLKSKDLCPAISGKMYTYILFCTINGTSEYMYTSIYAASVYNDIFKGYKGNL